MKLRRKLRIGLLVVFAALAGWVGLAWHRHRQAVRIADTLRLMGAEAWEEHEMPGWWKRIAGSVGIAPERGPFARTTISVALEGAAATKEALQVAAGHPGLIRLTIKNSPEFDDDALGAARGCDSVTDFFLAEVGISDAGLRHLSGWSKLRKVTVFRCPITDEGVRFLCGLPSVEDIACQGRGLRHCEVHDLTISVPDVSEATPSKPLKVKGRLVFTGSPPTGGVRAVRVLVIDYPVETSFENCVVAPDGSFTGTADRWDKLRVGLNLVSVEVHLAGPPTVIYYQTPIRIDLP